MGRKITAEEMAERVGRYKKNPNLLIKSGYMVGFPYEPLESIPKTVDYHRNLGIYNTDIFKYTDHPSLPSHKFQQFTQQEIDMRLEYAAILNDRLEEDGKNMLIGKTIPVIRDSKMGVSMTMDFFSAHIPNQVEFVDKVPNDGIVKAKVLRRSGERFICQTVL